MFNPPYLKSVWVGILGTSEIQPEIEPGQRMLCLRSSLSRNCRDKCRKPDIARPDNIPGCD